MKKKVCLIIGARPNFMKAFPVYEALKEDFDLTLIHTGQHFDAKMSDVFFKQLKFPMPDIHLTLEKKSKSGDFDDKLYVVNEEYLKNKDDIINELMTYDGDLGQLGEIRDKLKVEFEKLRFDLVIVFGDVTSTLAAGIAAKMLNIELAHVESGLRSGDMKMPEEVNRILTDHITKYYFVTEQSGVDNLKDIGITEHVYLVGNTMIDTQKKYLSQAMETKYNEKLNAKSKEYVLITLHRPSNVDDLDKLKEIFDDFEELSKTEILVYPIHPRTKMNLEKLGYLKKVEDNPNIILDEPLGYLEFLCLMANCKYVVTDSGGVQEESTVLNIPCFTLRENTERPSTFIKNHGTNQLIQKISDIELKECKGSMELWDGNAHYRIYERLQIERHLKFRMGIFYDSKFANPNELSINRPNINAHAIELINVNTNDSEIKNKRLLDILKEIKMHSTKQNVNFPVRLTDGHIKLDGSPMNNSSPYLTFNRHINLRNEGILIPLKGYSNYGDWSFPPITDKCRWEDKINKMVWRGSVTGRVYQYPYRAYELRDFIKEYNLIIETLNLSLKKKPTDQSIVKNLGNNFLNYPRFNFCYFHQKSKYVDCGLIAYEEEKAISYENLFKERLTHLEQLKYKYQIIIDGNDWASSLPWILLQDCVAFMPETTYESIFTIDLIPWKHYVPIRSDFADVEEKILYMIKNDELSQEISRNSTMYMQQFKNNQLMDKIKIEAIKRYCKNCLI